MDKMDLREYSRFARQYWIRRPEADDDEVIQKYNESKQGKQASNTRLLGG